MSVTSANLRLQPQADAPKRARQELERVCLHLASGVRADAALLLSEVVTNAVMHARTMITVAIECDQAAVAVAVTDDSLQPPRTASRDDLDEGGRGLLLVEELSTRWGYGTSRDGAGKVIWFRIDG